MTAQTKMIIITSDEDIIRQFSFKKPQNTRIIDLDNNKQHASTETDGNEMIDMALLAELSKLNSSNDQVFKRALDLPQQNPSKPAKTPRRSLDMICAICGDRAIGFNYDVLSCASCKAFFRRNANQTADRIRCLTGRGDCPVAHETRRKCQKCRLEKCFASGMRKDFILSEEEKQYRKQRLEENRKVTTQRLSTTDSTSSSSVSNILSNPSSASPETDDLSQLLANVNEEDLINYEDKINLNEIDDASFELMSVEDWITVESLRSAFLANFQKDGPRHNFDDVVDQTAALITWSHMANQQALSVITFFRQIHEFESLHADDRFVLIKYNLFPLYPVLKCFLYNAKNYCTNDSEEGLKYQRFFKLFFGEECIREMFYNLTILLVGITEQDTAILALLLTILMFYQGLSMNEDEPPLKDPVAVYEAQTYYTKVLWNYMVNKWGEDETCKRFSKLLTTIFRMQTGAKIFREYFRKQFTTSETVDQIAPLMQTVLQIS